MQALTLLHSTSPLLECGPRWLLEAGYHICLPGKKMKEERGKKTQKKPRKPQSQPSFVSKDILDVSLNIFPSISLARAQANGHK